MVGGRAVARGVVGVVVVVEEVPARDVVGVAVAVGVGAVGEDRDQVGRVEDVVGLVVAGRRRHARVVRVVVDGERAVAVAVVLRAAVRLRQLAAIERDLAPQAGLAPADAGVEDRDLDVGPAGRALPGAVGADAGDLPERVAAGLGVLLLLAEGVERVLVERGVLGRVGGEPEALVLLVEDVRAVGALLVVGLAVVEVGVVRRVDAHRLVRVRARERGLRRCGHGERQRGGDRRDPPVNAHVQHGTPRARFPRRFERRLGRGGEGSSRPVVALETGVVQSEAEQLRVSTPRVAPPLPYPAAVDVSPGGGGYFWPIPQSKTTTSLRGADVPALHQHPHRRQRRPALRRHVRPHQPPGQALRLGQRLLAHRDRGPAGLPQRGQDQLVPDGGGHAQAAGARGRALPALGGLRSRLERAHDRRAALGLDGDHPRALGADQPERLELRERLPHADEARAAAGRVDDDVRQRPAEVLGELEPHGLLALDAVGLLERGDVEGAGLGRDLARDRAALVDQAVVQEHARAHHRRLVAVDGRDVARHHHGHGQAGRGAVGGQRAARVAGARRHERGGAQLRGARDRGGHPAGLERARSG